MTPLKPTITYCLTALLNYAAEQKQEHDDAALKSGTVGKPGHELTTGFRESEARIDQYVIDTLTGFRDNGVQMVNAEHVIPQTTMGNVNDTLFMQLRIGKITPHTL